MTPTLELDLTDLKCPLPILRAKKALATLETGQILSVRATDPALPTTLPPSVAKLATSCSLPARITACSFW